MLENQISNLVIQNNKLLTEALQKIDKNGYGLLFVVNEETMLCGAISDGDIRRWIIKNGRLDGIVSEIMNPNPSYLEKDNADIAEIILEKKDITAIPVVDENGHIIDIFVEKERKITLNRDKKKLDNVSVVIMAGGKGTRLYPYTKILPKPLIPIGDIPIVERVIDGFGDYGVNSVYMTVNYKKSMIMSYFQENDTEYNIQFVEENIPLGTGGSIKLINRKFDKPIFVANCDSLIRADYSDVYEQHLKSRNDITMVTALKHDVIPYGVVHAKENGELDYVDEKPTMSYLINTGMYVINPEMIDLIEGNKVFHMTDLVEKAKSLGYRVGMYPVSEDSFLDMGEFEEMKRMNEKLGVRHY